MKRYIDYYLTREINFTNISQEGLHFPLLLLLLCKPSMDTLNCSSLCMSWLIVFCDLWIFSSLRLGCVADPRSKWSLANFSCCSLIFVICSMLHPLPNALNFPEWKSAKSPNKALSICLTSGTWDRKEWCLISASVLSKKRVQRKK